MGDNGQIPTTWGTFLYKDKIVQWGISSVFLEFQPSSQFDVKRPRPPNKKKSKNQAAWDFYLKYFNQTDEPAPGSKVIFAGFKKRQYSSFDTWIYLFLITEVT